MKTKYKRVLPYIRGGSLVVQTNKQKKKSPESLFLERQTARRQQAGNKFEKHDQNFERCFGTPEGAEVVGRRMLECVWDIAKPD